MNARSERGAGASTYFGGSGAMEGVPEKWARNLGLYQQQAGRKHTVSPFDPPSHDDNGGNSAGALYIVSDTTYASSRTTWQHQTAMLRN